MQVACTATRQAITATATPIISPLVELITKTVTPTPLVSNTLSPGAQSLMLQERNNSSRIPLQPKRARELADNRIGQIFGNFWRLNNFGQLLDTEISNLGTKRIRLSINEADTNQVDWSKPELEIDPNHDQFITNIASEGVKITYRLQFWDKACRAAGGQVSYPRFKSEDQIQRYLDFVRFIVRHFKDRIQYYEIWNEPACEGMIQCIEVEDYINLIKRTVPVIRQEYPEAKTVVGSVAGLDTPEIRNYLFKFLESDVMSSVDVVTWHPLSSTSPEYNYQFYYSYPVIAHQIKEATAVHGFKGEYMAEELNYARPDCGWYNSSDHLYSNTVAVKYYARGIMLHLGMGVSVGVAGNSSIRRISFTVIRNLCTIMAGAKPESLSIETQSQVANIKSYSFSIPNGERLIALWTNGMAGDVDPGVKTTLIIQDFLPQKVIGIDILHNFEQQLLTNMEDGNLIIRDLFIKDYPIIFRLTE